MNTSHLALTGCSFIATGSRLSSAARWRRNGMPQPTQLPLGACFAASLICLDTARAAPSSESFRFPLSLIGLNREVLGPSLALDMAPSFSDHMRPAGPACRRAPCPASLTPIRRATAKPC